MRGINPLGYDPILSTLLFKGVADEMAGGGTATDDAPVHDAMSRGADEDAVIETDETDTSDESPFQEAHRLAKEEHSKQEHAPRGKVSTETETETEKSARAKAGAATDDKTATTEKGKAETGLLSDEEFTALQTKHADDPAALRKALEGAFTKKTQALSAEAKSVERLRNYSDIIDAYEEDPVALIEALAEQHGVKLTTKGTETGTETATTEAATTEAADALVEKFRTKLGPELDYLADGLLPAIKELIEDITKSTVETTVKPLREHADRQNEKAALETTNTVMSTFEKDHPDWKDHESAMLKLAERVSPKGMTELEFLGHLYDNVTSKTRTEKEIAKGVKAALDKVAKGAETTETREEATPSSQVKKGPRGVPSFEEAAEAARRGERWD